MFFMLSGKMKWQTLKANSYLEFLYKAEQIKKLFR